MSGDDNIDYMNHFLFTNSTSYVSCKKIFMMQSIARFTLKNSRNKHVTCDIRYFLKIIE